MDVGASRLVDVIAREQWNPTGVLVSPGQRYSFAASGRWKDGGIRCDAAGFTSGETPLQVRWLVKAGVPLLRFKNGRYFCLIGSVGRDKSEFFAIGAHVAEWSTGSQRGHLECFANDVPFAYGNNKESVKLTITRLF